MPAFEDAITSKYFLSNEFSLFLFLSLETIKTISYKKLFILLLTTKKQHQKLFVFFVLHLHFLFASPFSMMQSKMLAPLKNQIRRVITNTLMWRRHIFLIYDSNKRKKKICNRKNCFYGSILISIGIISVKKCAPKAILSMKYGIKLVYFDIQINFCLLTRRLDAFCDKVKPKH